MKAWIVALGMMIGVTAATTNMGCLENEPDCVDQTGKALFCEECCKVCSASEPCGDSCISASQTCNVGPGCACEPKI